jgi:hypothetical protein
LGRSGQLEQTGHGQAEAGGQTPSGGLAKACNPAAPRSDQLSPKSGCVQRAHQEAFNFWIKGKTLLAKMAGVTSPTAL